MDHLEVSDHINQMPHDCYLHKRRKCFYYICVQNAEDANVTGHIKSKSIIPSRILFYQQSDSDRFSAGAFENRAYYPSSIPGVFTKHLETTRQVNQGVGCIL